MSSNQAVPKTFLYGLANATPAVPGSEESWVPLVCDGNGVLTFGTQAVFPGGTLSTEKNTSRIPSADTVNPTSPGNTLAQDVAAFGYAFNEYQITGRFNRVRSNENPIVLASAARTATVESATFTNYNARGAHIVIDVSAITATPSIVVKVQGQNPANLTQFYDILVSTAIVATGTTILKVYPGITTIPNASASDILPWGWRVRVEHADTDSITYSVAANVVL